MLSLKQRLVLSLVVLPGTVTIVIPGVLLAVSRRLDWLTGSPSYHALFFGLGIVLLAFGLFLAISSMSLFNLLGKGTVAPWDPPQKLVIAGVYRHVRNPMISGVCLILLSEALISGSNPLLIWFLIFMVGNWLYIPIVEEPSLEQRFGEDYARYKTNVPRWIPRSKPWSQDPSAS